jgi:hypothetical protein
MKEAEKYLNKKYQLNEEEDKGITGSKLLRCFHCGDLVEKQYNSGGSGYENWYCADCFIRSEISPTPSVRYTNELNQEERDKNNTQRRW